MRNFGKFRKIGTFRKREICKRHGKPPEANRPQSRCPNCGGEYIFKSNDVALNILCNNCGNKILVPGLIRIPPPVNHEVEILEEPRGHL